MLTKLREGASSWPAKVVLCVVALSFVGWGVGDIFVGRGETTVAEVGSTDIDVLDLQTAYRNQVRSLQSAGIRIDPGSDLARAQARIALDRLVRNTLLENLARDFGVTTGEDTLRAAIAGNRNFQDLAGNFDRTMFAGVLSMNGLTEEVYLAILGAEITRNQFVGSVVAAPPLPEDLLRRLWLHREERRTAEIAVIPNGALVSAPVPSEGELGTWFDERAESYRAPEYRSADYLLVYPQDIAEDMEIAGEDIETAYDADIGRWTVPEQRLVRQIRFETLEEAEDAHGASAGSPDFDSIEAQWYGREDLFGDLGEVVFAAAEGGVTTPVESPLGGWLVYRIDEVRPGSVTSLEEARDSIDAELRLREARYAMFDLANDLDDILATGATVREAAAALDFDVRSLDRVASTGEAEVPESLQVVPAVPGFLDEVFLGDTGFASTVIETDDGGLLVVEVTDVVPSRSRSLDEARSEVLGDWQAERQSDLALREARRLAESAGKTGNLNDIMAFADVSFELSEPFSRNGIPSMANVPSTAVEALFEAWPGDTVVTPSADGHAQVVARLTDVIAADFFAGSQESERLESGLKQDLLADVVELGSSSMREAVSVSINHDLIDQYF